MYYYFFRTGWSWLNLSLGRCPSILRQVVDTPQEIPFLSVLEHSLQIDPKEAVSDVVWDKAKTIVHLDRRNKLTNPQSAQCLLLPKSQWSQNFCLTIRKYFIHKFIMSKMIWTVLLTPDSSRWQLQKHLAVSAPVYALILLSDLECDGSDGLRSNWVTDQQQCIISDLIMHETELSCWEFKRLWE